MRDTQGELRMKRTFVNDKRDAHLWWVNTLYMKNLSFSVSLFMCKPFGL